MVRSARKKESITAMIPARMGSARLAMKNLALLNGKPLIYYAINAAKTSGAFDRIVLNSEDVIFGKIAKRYNVDFYHRPAQWATSQAKSDFVVYDFLKNNPCDIIAWVNPTSPLQTGAEIRAAADYFLKERLDSLITVKNEQVHCVYKGKPVNFKLKEVFARTQDLEPVQPFVYSVMMWRADIFARTFEKNGHAFFCGKAGFYPAGKFSGIIIKREEDLMFADYILRAASKNKAYKVRYDKIIKKERSDELER
jgi:CMP-N-acetylneuraminic acid synthetase